MVESFKVGLGGLTRVLGKGRASGGGAGGVVCRAWAALRASRASAVGALRLRQGGVGGTGLVKILFYINKKNTVALALEPHSCRSYSI